MLKHFSVHLFVAFTFYWSTGFAIKPCAHEIIFLPQTHVNDLTADGKFGNDTIVSQYNIATYLLAHQDAPVFSEDTHYDDTVVGWRSKNPNQDNLFRSVQRAFKMGMPPSIHLLSEQQKNLLGEYGASFILLLSGQLAEIHKTEYDEATYNKDFEAVKNYMRTHPNATITPGTWLYKKIHTDRERFVLKSINDFFSKNPSKKVVVLVFGSIHDFDTYPDLFPTECVKIPNSFQGAYAEGHPSYTHTKNVQQESYGQ